MIKNKYAVIGARLPETSNWDDTPWLAALSAAVDAGCTHVITEDRIIYKINSKDSVTNISFLTTFTHVHDMLMNSSMKSFRLGWAPGTYIQMFIPAQHGLETISMQADDEVMDTAPLLPFVMMRTQDGYFIPWSPTPLDQIAADWVIEGHNIGDFKPSDKETPTLEKAGTEGMIPPENIVPKEVAIAELSKEQPQDAISASQE